MIVWRFTGSRLVSDAAEHRAQRLVALQFFALAPYVAVESIQALLAGERPEVSYVGMALAASSVVVMPLLGVAKQRIGAEMGSTATRGEGTQNLLCAYLAAALFLGLAGTHLPGRGGSTRPASSSPGWRSGRARHVARRGLLRRARRGRVPRRRCA